MLYDVFISYCTANEEVAQKVEKALTAYGMKVWKANEFTIQGGQNFQENILNALHESRVCLLLLSKESMESKWVQLELTQALMNNMTIYPLRLDDSDIPELISFKLGLSQYVDGVSNLTAAIENIHLNIKKERDRILKEEVIKNNKKNATKFIPFYYSYFTLLYPVSLVLVVAVTISMFVLSFDKALMSFFILISKINIGVFSISALGFYHWINSLRMIKYKNPWAAYVLYIMSCCLFLLKKAKKFYNLALEYGHPFVINKEIKKNLDNEDYCNELRNKKAKPRFSIMTFIFDISFLTLGVFLLIALINF